MYQSSVNLKPRMQASPVVEEVPKMKGAVTVFFVADVLGNVQNGM
jgi:hypothetical protein